MVSTDAGGQEEPVDCGACFQIRDCQALREDRDVILLVASCNRAELQVAAPAMNVCIPAITELQRCLLTWKSVFALPSVCIHVAGARERSMQDVALRPRAALTIGSYWHKYPTQCAARPAASSVPSTVDARTALSSAGKAPSARVISLAKELNTSRPGAQHWCPPAVAI